MTKFWMVLGDGTPVYRHYGVHEAKAEAERLARVHPGKTFVVLESIGSVTKTDVTWNLSELSSGIPF